MERSQLAPVSLGNIELLMIVAGVFAVTLVSWRVFISGAGQQSTFKALFRRLHMEKISTDRKSVYICGSEIDKRACQIAYSVDRSLRSLYRMLRRQKPAVQDRISMRVQCHSSMIFAIRPRKEETFLSSLRLGAEEFDGLDVLDPQADEFGQQLEFRSDHPDRMVSWLENAETRSNIGWMFFSMGVEAIVLTNDELMSSCSNVSSFQWKEENFRKWVSAMVWLAEQLENMSFESEYKSD